MTDQVQGWKAIVASYVRRVAPDPMHYFSIDDLKPFYSEMLAIKQSRNAFIGEKVRQQLQILRDDGMVAFLIPGSYRRLK